MSKPFKKILKEGFEKLKQVIEQITTNGKKQNKPSLVLQPVRQSRLR
jgi:hypothetical protein